MQLVKSWTALQNVLTQEAPSTVSGLFEVDDGTIKLLTDFMAAEGDKKLTVTGTKTLDLNNHFISNGARTTRMIEIGSGATLNLVDKSETKTDTKFKVSDDANEYVRYWIKDSSGEKTVTGGYLLGSANFDDDGDSNEGLLDDSYGGVVIAALSL